jgi:hypothetical protein
MKETLIEEIVSEEEMQKIVVEMQKILNEVRF